MNTKDIIVSKNNQNEEVEVVLSDSEGEVSQDFEEKERISKIVEKIQSQNQSLQGAEVKVQDEGVDISQKIIIKDGKKIIRTSKKKRTKLSFSKKLKEEEKVEKQQIESGEFIMEEDGEISGDEE